MYSKSPLLNTQSVDTGYSKSKTKKEIQHSDHWLYCKNVKKMYDSFLLYKEEVIYLRTLVYIYVYLFFGRFSSLTPCSRPDC